MPADLRIKGAPGRRGYLNAHLIDASSGIDGSGGILIDDGRIVAVGPQVTAAAAGAAATIVDCRGAVLMPGLIDMRVITGEPGKAPRNPCLRFSCRGRRRRHHHDRDAEHRSGDR